MQDGQARRDWYPVIQGHVEFRSSTESFRGCAELHTSAKDVFKWHCQIISILSGRAKPEKQSTRGGAQRLKWNSRLWLQKPKKHHAYTASGRNKPAGLILLIQGISGCHGGFHFGFQLMLALLPGFSEALEDFDFTRLSDMQSVTAKSRGNHESHCCFGDN